MAQSSSIVGICCLCGKDEQEVGSLMKGLHGGVCTECLSRMMSSFAEAGPGPSIESGDGLCNLENSALVVVDIQPTFLNPIHEKERVLKRSEFLVKIASLLHVPILATEQYPERMGGTEEGLATLLSNAGTELHGKMSFSCAGCDPFAERLNELEKTQVVLVGIETHICVNQTAHHLLEAGYEVFLAADAMGAREPLMHQIGLTRMCEAGAILTHTESVAYEWMGSAEHPSFREALKIVKEYSST